jgi:MerR family transcriptional regulator/heat shock protein HspR
MYDDTTPMFVISVAAELSGLHPQTLRTYDRLGLVSPDRAVGRGRRYSSRDIEQLREVQRLSQQEGLNLAGIKRILELENQVLALQQRVAELRHEAARQVKDAHASHRRDLVPFAQASAIVVWRPVPEEG